MCIDGRGGSAASIATAYETPSAYVPVCCLPVHVVWFGAGGGATRISVNESEGNKWDVPIPVFVCARTCARTTWLKSYKDDLGQSFPGNRRLLWDRSLPSVWKTPLTSSSYWILWASGMCIEGVKTLIGSFAKAASLAGMSENQNLVSIFKPLLSLGNLQGVLGFEQHKTRTNSGGYFVAGI